MKIGYLVFLQYSEEYNNFSKEIYNNFKQINSEDKYLYIVTEENKKTNYLKEKNIKHIFYNTEKFYQEGLEKNLFLKKKNRFTYNKYQRFLILYLSYIFINKNYKNIEYLLYLHNSIKIKSEINISLFKDDLANDFLFAYFDRSVINYLDDPTFQLINYKNKKFDIFENYLLKKINNANFCNELELTIEYISTNIRHYIKNIFDIQCVNLANKINYKNKNNFFYILEATKFSKFFEISKNYKNNYNLIRKKKLNNFKKANMNINFLFKNLELSGLFDKSILVINVCNEDNNLKQTFKNINIKNINFLDFDYNLLDNKKSDIIFFDDEIFYNKNCFNIILNSKTKIHKIIIRKNLYINSKNENDYYANFLNKIKNKQFKVKIIKNVNSDIIILT